MNTLFDAELIRTRWRRHLAVQALDDCDCPGFSLGGLGARVQEPTARLFLLPADPDIERFDLDEQFWERLNGIKNIAVGDGQICLGEKPIPTAHAAALVDDRGDGEPWKSYAAVHRNGAIEFGLGERGGCNRTVSADESRRYFHLVSIVVHAWSMAELARTLNEDDMTGPWLLSVALRDTVGALLANLGDGWAHPWYPYSEVGGCPDRHLLWHVELDQLPENQSASKTLAFKVGNRIMNAWGSKQRLYLDGLGDLAGELNVHRATR